MGTVITYTRVAIAALFCALVLALVAPMIVSATAHEHTGDETQTFSFSFRKYADHMDVDDPRILQFGFHLIGDNGVNHVYHDGDTPDLPAGNYSLTEVGGPEGWAFEKWGGTCTTNVDTNDDATVYFTLDDEDLNNSQLGCQIYNCKLASQDDPGTCDFDDDNGPQNGTLVVNKVVVGGSAATSSFSFSTSDTANSTNFESDGSNSFTMNVGQTFDVQEDIATGYTPTYAGTCSGTMTAQGATCTITNTFTGNGTTTPSNGTLIVNKVVINNNGGVGTTSDFSFQVNDSTYSFGADGSNAVSLPAGTYTVTEVGVAGYSASYLGCSNIVLAASGTATCTITNDDIQGGGGNGTTTLYKVEGYVWEDTDKDGVFDEGESGLSGWDVVIADANQPEPEGDDDIVLYDATVSGDGGYYSFMVPAGTWLIAEELKEQWELTFPLGESEGVHTVTVPEEEPEEEMMTQNALSSFFALFVNTAHAQAPQVFGPFNFGNFFNGCTSNCGGGGDNNDDGDGSGKRISLSSSGSNNDDEDEPVGEVAGAVAPIGAPNAGMGGAGAGSLATTLMLMLGLIASAFTGRRTA